jgi:cyclopropane fatty-acyl-phospholipid synthase-like methyltransferase
VTDLRGAIGRGHYASKQLFSRDKLIAWSHARRFHTAVALAGVFSSKRVLDYGSGDGTFLAMTMMTPDAPGMGVGAELSAETVSECRRRYREEPRLQFVQVKDLAGSDHMGRYDAVFCMEVLEHVVDWNPEVARFKSLLKPDGRLVVSVPVETGVPLMVKQTVRRIAGWRKIGHYPGTSSYSMVEMASGIFAGATQHVCRPIFDTGAGPFHDHKGFNWMVLKERLQQDFIVERVLASPFPWLGPHLATQAWLIARLPA